MPKEIKIYKTKYNKITTKSRAGVKYTKYELEVVRTKKEKEAPVELNRKGRRTKDWMFRNIMRLARETNMRDNWNAGKKAKRARLRGEKPVEEVKELPAKKPRAKKTNENSKND